jgi:hypothetical protein
MIDVAIIVGSLADHAGAPIANWIHGIASKRSDARFLVDILDFKLPFLDEPAPAMMGKYTRPHTELGCRSTSSTPSFS